MSVLADAALRRCYLNGQPLVTPLKAGAIQPSSIDLTLGGTLKRLPYGVVLDPAIDQSDLWQDVVVLDPAIDQSDLWQDVPLRADGRWLLGQGTFYLGTTEETVSVPTNMLALLHGVSSLGRLGLLVHCTAGVADAGYSGRLTLEILPLAGSIYLTPGMRIAQVTYQFLTTPAEAPYRGRYQSDVDPTPSRAFRDWEAAP